MTGRHTRRPSRLSRALTLVAACTVLGVGAWSGTYLHADGTDVSGSAPPATIPAGRPTPEPSPPATATAPPAPPAPPTPSPTAPASTQPVPPPAEDSVAAYEQQVVMLLNSERAAAGCGALAVDDRLATAARAHSADMAARGYFDHTTPDGVTFDERINNAGYAWSLVAENIARGQRDPAAVMAAWMGSDGHRRNILNCDLRHVGVGLAYDSADRPHWTQDFGAPAN